jgi:hypothetical protein
METHDSFFTDEITAIRGALPQPPPPSPHVVAQSRSLLRQRTQQRARHPRWRAMSSRRPYLAGVAVTACAAAAVAAAVLIPGSSHTSPATTRVPAWALPSAPARAFLLAMATKAAHQSIGRYYCATVVAGERELVGTDGRLLPRLWLNGPRHIRASAPEGFAYALMTKEGGVACVKPNPIGYHAGYGGLLGARPASPADARAWRRAGSPSHWGHLSMRPETPTAESFIKRDGTGDFGLTNYLKVPADPARLRAFILAHPGPALTRRDDILEDGALALMSDPVRPAVRAAALRILASVPGLRMKPGVTDPQGQVVTAISYVASYQPWDTELILFDPQTATVIGEETVARTPVEGFAPGTVLSYDVDTSQGWTNHLPVGVTPPKP